MSQAEFDETRRAARKLFNEKLGSSMKDIRAPRTGPEPESSLAVNPAKWAGFLDFIEFDLYNAMIGDQKPNPNDYNMLDPKEADLFEKSVVAWGKYKKEMYSYFDGFSALRRGHTFDKPQRWFALIEQFRKYQDDAVDYFTDAD